MSTGSIGPLTHVHYSGESRREDQVSRDHVVPGDVRRKQAGTCISCKAIRNYCKMTADSSYLSYVDWVSLVG